MRNKILIVDDEHLQRWAIRQQLTAWGHDVIEADNGRSALDAYQAQLPDLVLLDLRLADQSGLDVLRQIRTVDGGAVVVMVSAHGELGDAVDAFRLGLFDYLSKPIDFEALRVALRLGLEARRLRTEVQRWRESDRSASGATIIGKSKAIASAIALMQKAAASSTSTILLQGESGTGKDLFAKAIHYNSSLTGGPFVSVNCAALPDALLESELFGHERGAFTDARSLKKGVFELADGGTLYLDEVGELKPSLQAKVLHAIENLTFRRVGGERDIKVDVRLVAASNRNLEQDVRTGEFRADLFYRLSVIELWLPPLRERPEDIQPLAEHFIKDYSVKFRKPIHGMTPEAFKAMTKYRWPGNIRELRNAIERAVLLEESDRIGTTYLPEAAVLGAGSRRALRAINLALPAEGTSLEGIEEELVRQAMAMAGGNQTRAARLLDISRDALRYKLKKFGVTTDDEGDRAGELEGREANGPPA